jgi:hypothetical protein
MFIECRQGEEECGASVAVNGVSVVMRSSDVFKYVAGRGEGLIAGEAEMAVRSGGRTNLSFGRF